MQPAYFFSLSNLAKIVSLRKPVIFRRLMSLLGCWGWVGRVDDGLLRLLAMPNSRLAVGSVCFHCGLVADGVLVTTTVVMMAGSVSSTSTARI